MPPRFALIAFGALLLGGCQYQSVPDPAFSARDARYMAMVPKFETDLNYERYMVDDPTGQAPGVITVDTKENFLYLSLDGAKAIRYGVSTGAEAFGWTGMATVKRAAEWPDWMPPADMVARWPHLKPVAAAGGLKGGPESPPGRAGLVPVPGRARHALPHPRHQRARNDRPLGFVRLHSYAQRGRDRPLQPGGRGDQSRGQVSGAAPTPTPAIVTSTSSGGRMKRTGRMEVPSPAEITRWRSSSTMWP